MTSNFFIKPERQKACIYLLAACATFSHFRPKPYSIIEFYRIFRSCGM